MIRSLITSKIDDQLFDLHSKQTALDLAPITFESRSLLLQKNHPE